MTTPVRDPLTPGELLLLWDADRPRSQQREIGWSDLGVCRRRAGYRLAGVEPTNRGGSIQAAMGSAIHLVQEEALRRYVPAASAEEEVEFAGIVGHLDRYEHGTVADTKGLALDTPIPTPSGWTTMGEIKVGDQVFGSDGKPCRVTLKSEVKDIGTYVVRFHDGTSVVCDTEHLWWVTTQRRPEPHVVDIETIARTVRIGGRQSRYRVPVAGALDLSAVDLPIDPYVLGAWLGDGHAAEGRITKTDELFDEIRKCGHAVTPEQRYPSQVGDAVSTRTISGLTSKLRLAGLLDNKHIPGAYLRAATEQRIALLQGLCDTDGGWNQRRRRASFSTCSKQIAEDVYELLCSLGQKPSMNWSTARGFGIEVQVCQIEWTPMGVMPFRMPSKASRVCVSRLQQVRSSQRTITAVESGPDVLTACIAVDSPDRTYLCGRAMIPTHNTTSSRWLDTIRRDGPPVANLWQINGYAAAVIASGRPVHRLILDYLARDTGEEHRWTGRPDPQMVRDALGWLREVRDTDLGWLPRDHQPDSPFCRGCPFLDACWPEQAGPIVRDRRAVLYTEAPDAARWIAQLEQARADKTDAERREKEAKGALDALRPNSIGTVVLDVGADKQLQWTVKTSQRLDSAQVRKDYAAAGLEPPTKESTSVTLTLVTPESEQDAA